MSLRSNLIGFLIMAQFWLTFASDNQNSETYLKRTSWLKMTKSFKDKITLECHDPQYYPFNDTNAAKRIVWRILMGDLFLDLEANQKQLGWKVLPNGISLQVDPTLFPTATNIAGIYKCAILAPLYENNSYYAWHYLNWAVNYYADENLLVGLTAVEKYKDNMIILAIVWAIFLCIISLFKLLNVYSYNSRKNISDHIIR